MYEEIGRLLGKGFDTWKHNLNLCIPFLGSVIASLVAMIPILVAMYFAIMPVQVDASQEQFLQLLVHSLPTLIPAAALSIVLALAADSFFQAGAIGMAKQAISEGRATTGAMWSEGRRHFVSLFLATLITGIISMAGLAFMIPGLLALPGDILTNPGSISSISSLGETAIGLLAGGALMLIIYSLVISLLMSVVSYALVVDDLSPVQAIKASISFFFYNKFDVFLMWVVVVAISMGLQMISGSMASTEASWLSAAWSAITSIISLFVLAPLYTIWWTRLYMTRTRTLEEKDLVNDPW
ncbi:MAG TPA: hypothetical protein VN455_06695 [Methanotrichaceae archaeon]|nr:hypothetical protein [Methanotrichaceae archaeon]